MDTAITGGRLLWQTIRYGGGWIALLALVAPAGAVAELLLPAVLGLAVDGALGSGAGWWPAVAGGLVTVVVATDTLGQLAVGSGNARATARLRHRLLRHLIGLDPRTVAGHPVGDLVSRLVGQAADAGQAGTTLVLGVTSALPAAGSVVALTLLDPWLGVTFVVGLALLGVLLRTFVADASAAAAGYLRVQASIAGRLTETLAGARTIAAAGTVDAETARVLAPLSDLHAHGRRTWSALAGASARTAAVAPLLQLAIVAVGGWSVAAGRLTPGQLLAALGYASLGTGLGAVVATLNRLVRTRAGAGRVAAMLAQPARCHGRRTGTPGPGQLVLRDVTVYADDGRPILDRVTLRIPAGAAVAVVGASGSGKSMLAAVAGRLRDPDTGEVLLDGVPLRELTRAALTTAVGYGFERPVLVGDTLEEAILLGAPPEHRSTTALARLTSAAAIDGFVERLPAGPRTRLADVPMSGGEAQRLGLARALRADRLLILDDATSSVDSATEHRIARAIAADAGGRTRLLVTHRAATAAAADLVVWLDGGRLRAIAPHHELWRDPDYRAVFQPAAGAPR